MKGDPRLERIAQGNGLALCATGSWTAGFAPVLEQMVADAEKLTGSRPNIFIDVSQVSKLDTFGAWLKYSESIAARRTEKLDSYLEVLYLLLSDVLRITEGVPAVRNADIGNELQAVAARVSFDWLRRAVEKVDELVDLVRRNIQKSIALDAWAVDMLSTK